MHEFANSKLLIMPLVGREGSALSARLGIKSKPQFKKHGVPVFKWYQ